MDTPTQDSHRQSSTGTQHAVPKAGDSPRWRDLPWLVRYSLRGLWKLVLARIEFARFTARDITRRNDDARSEAGANSLVPASHVERIAYVLPRLSARLPWRSDCLVQAMAAQDWLLSSGLASEIQIGVERPDHGPFGAHAWLVFDGKVVTGGEIDRYSTILADDEIDPIP